jgi:hypothetical protein
MTGFQRRNPARLAELGLFIEDGKLVFDPVLLNRQELLTAPSLFVYLNGDGYQRQIDLKAGSLVYSFCQVPVVLRASDQACITVDWADGSSQVVAVVLAPDPANICSNATAWYGS